MKYDMFALICCIYFTCLVFCLFICLYPINVKAGKPIHPKCCVGPHLTPREGLWTMDINFLNVPIQIENPLQFENIYWKDGAKRPRI